MALRSQDDVELQANRFKWMDQNAEINETKFSPVALGLETTLTVRGVERRHPSVQ